MASSESIEDGSPHGILRAVRVGSAVVLVAISVLLLWQVSTAIVLRVPGELVQDRLGGVLVDHCVRIRDGLPTYSAPDESFVPVIYTPLYYYAGAAVMSVIGEGVPAARVTSLLFIAASAVVLGFVARRLTGSWWAAATVFPLVAAGYSTCLFFYDAPRVDSASTFALVLAIFFAVCGARRRRVGVIIGLCLVLAFWCKQSTTAFAGVFLLGLLVDHWKRAIVAGATYGVVLPASVALVTWATDGWFWKIGIALLPKHRLPQGKLLETLGQDWGGDLLPTAICLVLGAAGLWWLWSGSDGDRRVRLLMFAVVAVIVLTTLSRARTGATEKTLMPVCLVAAAAIPTTLWIWTRRLSRPSSRQLARVASNLLIAAVIAASWFPLAEALPSDDAVAKWNRLMDEVRLYAAKGQVWVAPWGYVTTPMEGQQMRPALVALYDYYGIQDDRADEPLPPGLARALAEQEFAAIFFPVREKEIHIRPYLERYYRQEKQLPVTVGVTGRTIRLRILTPNSDIPH